MLAGAGRELSLHPILTGYLSLSGRPLGTEPRSTRFKINPRTVVPAKENVMSVDDKAENKAEELKGKGKEAVGRATDDEQLEAEGQTDQAKGNIKQAGEKVKDIFK
jgi:uncharacterized protein YjbJ (UPF0337 family)